MQKQRVEFRSRAYCVYKFKLFEKDNETEKFCMEILTCNPVFEGPFQGRTRCSYTTNLNHSLMQKACSKKIPHRNNLQKFHE